MKRKILDTLRLIWKINFLEQLLVKMTTNKSFGSPVTKLPPNHYQFKKGSVRKVVRDGINYTLDISDIVDWYIYFGFKELSREALYDLIQEGQTVIDIGANVGDVTLHAAQIVGKNGEIHAFEPDPTNYKRLTANLNLNTFNNIRKNQVGLGHETGTFKIANIDSGNQGMNRIIQGKPTNLNTHEINVITLDSYALENRLEKIDLIKIDVEGFEYNVLKGSTAVINNFHPTFFIELDDDNLLEQGSSARKLIQFLVEKNYRIFHAENHKEVSVETDFQHCHFDILAKYISE
ncbi:MAG: FkbM family methyltransferase [Brumimicrobium sp.]|nr:FkbM family methyltransferase [Brumimicrobium sp.]